MKGSLLSAIVIVMQLGAVLWAGPAQTYNPGEGSFFGLVRDSANRPLMGVKVSAINTGTNLHREARMLPSGLFGVPFLPRGTYLLQAESAGFQTVIRVEPIEKGPSNVNFFMPAIPLRDGSPAGANVLTGTVRDFNYVSLREVKITIRDAASGKTQQVVSDVRGNYSVSDLPAGALEITAEREGFQTLRLGDIRLTGKLTQLHLKLQHR